MSFWIWIVVLVLGIVGVSVLVGMSINRRKPRVNPRDDKLTALKMSGALQHRKSNRN